MSLKDALEHLKDPWGVHTTGDATYEPMPEAPGGISPSHGPSVQENRIADPRIHGSLLDGVKPTMYSRLRWIGDENRAVQSRPGQINAAGTVEIIVAGPVGPRERWRIDRIALQTFDPTDNLYPLTFTPAPSVYVFAGSSQQGMDPGSLIDGTNSGHFSVAASAAPITLGDGMLLRVLWVGMTASSPTQQVSCRIHYDRYLQEVVPMMAMIPPGEPV